MSVVSLCLAAITLSFKGKVSRKLWMLKIMGMGLAGMILINGRGSHPKIMRHVDKNVFVSQINENYEDL